MNTVDFKNAQWIWGEDNKTPGQKMIFRTMIELDKVPEVAETFIA